MATKIRLPDVPIDVEEKAATAARAAEEAEKNPEPVDEEETAPRRGVVKYVGTADIREITAAQLAVTGYQGGHTIAWSKRNRFEVPLSEFDGWPDSLFQDVVTNDPSLIVVEDE